MGGIVRSCKCSRTGYQYCELLWGMFCRLPLLIAFYGSGIDDSITEEVIESEVHGFANEFGWNLGDEDGANAK